ncbi:carboxypeptidase regulatory-like domain-containing protein [Pseudomonadota bacterium]
MNTKTRIWFSVLSLILMMGLSPVLFAAETTSSIKGNVYDGSGNPIAGASVVVEDLRTNVARPYTTNSAGAFLASKLPVGGPYKVTVNSVTSSIVDRITLGEIHNMAIEVTSAMTMEEVVVTGENVDTIVVAAGPAATFSTFQIETSVAFNRDIVDIYTIDPRLNLDNQDDGFAMNCAGKNPRFNSITLDGVSMNDRFGLNDNGYSTAVGMPFPYDGVRQVAVELAPFDVTYGGFSACAINAVTKTGANEWFGGAYYEMTNDSLRGDSLTVGPEKRDLSTADFTEYNWGFNLGGAVIKDKLFFFAAYEEFDKPRFLARGPAGSGNGEERRWLSQADYDRIDAIARDVYGYDTGGQPTDGAQAGEKYMVRLDWSINENHSASFIYNYFDGFQDRDSDGDSYEFEFANHFYKKGSESTTYTLKLDSQWTDAFSTEVFASNNEMQDTQVTVGDWYFADHQISINRDAVYLGADDSRQANSLNTDSNFYKFVGKYLAGNHVITAGYEREELTIFNIFVQHSRGGEYDYFDDSGGNPAYCAALSAQGRFEDPDCDMSGIDKFELGRPSRIYYGSGGGSNVATDAAAEFTNNQNSLYIQDELYFPNKDLSIVFGLRYEWFDSKDAPNFNQTFTDANGGLRNDATIDGVDILMPRLGFTWGVNEDLQVRGGFGLYSGGNPNVWISNSYSNDGLTNVQTTLSNFSGSGSVLDGSIPIVGDRPGFDVPQELYDQVAATTAANASDSYLALIDPNFKQPSDWKIALGATYMLPQDVQMDLDWLHSRTVDSAVYVDLSQSVVGQTTLGYPIYDYTNGEDNFMLTNSKYKADADILSVNFSKFWDNGLDMSFGYAYTAAEDVSPMTSSVAQSNFSNLAVTDINNPKAADSNYVVPHRFTLRASWGHAFWSDYETRITLFGFSKQGQGQSYIMAQNNLEGDGFFGRHLLYVPTGLDDPNVVFGSGFDTDAFFEWVEDQGLKQGMMKRNSKHAMWSTRFDLRINQELPFIKSSKARLYMKIYNLGNLISDKWGHVNDAEFFTVGAVNAAVNDDGQYVYSSFAGSDTTVNYLRENRSLWDIRLGLEINF